jgi:hypothetical protein
MRIADHPKKLGLLLLPLIPLSAIGIVHVVDNLTSSSECTCTAAPIVETTKVDDAYKPMPAPSPRPDVAPPA